jgi:two-component system, sensor histidine kinase PdtaS
MTNSVSVKDTAFWLPWARVARRDETQYDALTVELRAAHAREEALLREKSDLLQRQDMLAQEFEHRLVNSLQIIVSLLSLQSRNAGPDAAAQLTIAANRVASFGRVHRGLHLLDHRENVEPTAI